ncbi:MAG TPA: 3-phosphoshikimate 1-carboxyvinyltransferase [Myxococcota bacterium]|nr:3-phosphoshikimate 1-carboxyvinyltransferase [Myxococcota bacterium]
MSHADPHDTVDTRARSPWSPLHGVTEAHVGVLPGPLRATLRVPGSKSYTNRALILAAAARGPSMLRGILRSDDSYWCIDALGRLGVRVEVDGDVARVEGCAAAPPRASEELFIGSAGTTARFLPGILAASRGGPWRLDGSAQLRRRPLATLVEALRQLGGEVGYAGEGEGLPLVVRGEGLQGGDLAMSGKVSSQFISGVLMASPLARGPVTVRITDHIVQHAYVMMTLDMMRGFGVSVEHDAELTRMRVTPQAYVGSDLPLEADASTAGYFFALAALSGGSVRIDNLGANTRQPDIKLTEVLERMGCRLARGPGSVTLEGPQALQGGFTVSMKELSDQTLTLAAIAPFASAPITLTEVAHIRHHESDRIRAVCEVLGALGIRTDEHPDGLTVHPGTPRGASVRSYDDHRVAMSTALIGTRVPGVIIQDPGCVSKTCPTFFEELGKCGVPVILR